MSKNKSKYCSRHHEIMTGRTMFGTGLGVVASGLIGFGPVGIIAGAVIGGIIAYNTDKAKDERGIK